ncbi:MAG: nucleotidyltransferase family protein [Anaerolineales bacterium]
MSIRVDLSRPALANFCRQHHVRRLAFFGSVLREDFRPDSDVDVLVEFEPGYTPGFFALDAMQAELSGLLDGRRVDLVTEKFLNHRLRRRVLASAEVAYAQR